MSYRWRRVSLALQRDELLSLALGYHGDKAYAGWDILSEKGGSDFTAGLFFYA